jgi:hypothetical protein
MRFYSFTFFCHGKVFHFFFPFVAMFSSLLIRSTLSASEIEDTPESQGILREMKAVIDEGERLYFFQRIPHLILLQEGMQWSDGIVSILLSIRYFIDDDDWIRALLFSYSISHA